MGRPPGAPRTFPGSLMGAPDRSAHAVILEVAPSVARRRRTVGQRATIHVAARLDGTTEAAGQPDVSRETSGAQPAGVG